MGRLAGGIAHDFNNILTAIVGHAEMLKLDIKSDDEAYEDVEGIARTAERASKLTKQLLGFSRKQPYSPKPIGISSVVSDMSALLRRLAGEAILFSVFTPSFDPMIFADPVQIEQALINLVVNARDALEGKPDARISIVIGEEKLTEVRTIGKSSLPPGSYVTLEVADNGCGIPAKIADKIFEPFFTTKATGKGTGLGLAIVASIASQTGGAVDLETKEGIGTAFTLWFPVFTSDGDEASRAAFGPEAGFIQPAIAANLALEGNPNILLVEDDEDLLGFLAYILAKAGALVFSARNAGEAMLLAEKGSCDVLVADINLPGLDGIALYERLAAKSPMKCVFMTGRLDEATKLPKETLLLEKPFTPQE
ncbi:MAG TPA: ATP-binding protein, partial [Rectinemataceae bacterium]|nr:ATP-binding protein [Rectinemataceae bacterium]